MEFCWLQEWFWPSPIVGLMCLLIPPYDFGFTGLLFVSKFRALKIKTLCDIWYLFKDVILLSNPYRFIRVWNALNTSLGKNKAYVQHRASVTCKWSYINFPALEGFVYQFPLVLSSILPWSYCSVVTKFTQRYACEGGNNSQAAKPPRFAKHLWASSFTSRLYKDFIQVRMILPSFTFS